jgi:hypothetical protein
MVEVLDCSRGRGMGESIGPTQERSSQSTAKRSEGGKPMPWLVHCSVAGGGVSHDFDPDIALGSLEDKRLKFLIGSRHLTADELARVPPRLVVGRNSSGDVPAIMGWSTGPFVVSQAVHDILEELEPGVQQFRPITVVAKDGKAIKGNATLPYFILMYPPPLTVLTSTRRPGAQPQPWE